MLSHLDQKGMATTFKITQYFSIFEESENKDQKAYRLNTFFGELDNVRDVRVLGFSLYQNLKRGH